jgi:hypothetical protein
MHTEFWSHNLKENDHLGDLGIDVRTVLKWILKKRSVYWIHVVQDNA